MATIESIGSSTRIEGSKLTDREVEKLLSKLEIKKFDSRDEQEVAGYAETMEMIFHAFGDVHVTETISSSSIVTFCVTAKKMSAIEVSTKSYRTMSLPLMPTAR